MRSKRIATGVAAASVVGGLSACGGDGAMAPQPGPTVAGQWIYSAAGLTGEFFGDPVSCDYDLVMQIPVTGPSFSGLYSNAMLICTLSGPPQLVDFGGGTVVAGSLAGDSVHFDFDSESIHNAGTISGDRMNGQVEVELVIQVDAQSDTVQVIGSWTATR